MERVCKVIQLSILIGFASVGSHFLPHLTDERTFESIRTLDILLMSSRSLLAIQYAVIAAFAAKKHKDAVLPLMLVVLAFIIAGAVYLGVSCLCPSASIQNLTRSSSFADLVFA